MTKVELELRVEELEKQLEEKEKEVSLLKDAKTQNKSYVEEIYHNKKEMNKLKQSLDQKVKSSNELGSKFNELAALFDEYMKNFEDTININELFLRNIKRGRELMNIKITAFNGKEGEKE